MTVPLSETLAKELMFFGLTLNEAKVYLALLQLKESNARSIAKFSNVPRQEIYRVLPRLEKLGMVEIVLGKPTKFLAIGPEIILPELIEGQQEIFNKKISELQKKERRLEKELKKVEGRSFGLTQPEPVKFILISGQHLVDNKIKELLSNAKNEVLWMVPKFDIRRAVFFERDKMLGECAQRNVKIRIITEVSKKNVKEIKKLGRFCEIRHTPEVMSLFTIADNKELIMGSAVYTSENLTSNGLVHKLWTNDSAHITVMKDFFEKIWNDSSPINLSSG